LQQTNRINQARRAVTVTLVFGRFSSLKFFPTFSTVISVHL